MAAAAASARRHTLVPCPVPIPRARSPRSPAWSERPSRWAPATSPDGPRASRRWCAISTRPCPAPRPCARSGPSSTRAPTRWARRSAGCAAPSAGARTGPPTRRRPSSSRWSPGPRTPPRRHGWSTRAPGRDASRSPPAAASRGPGSWRWSWIPWRPSAAAATWPRPGSPGAPAWRPVDYRALPPEASGEAAGTLYLGNPPYVRHHQIAARLEGVAHAHRARARPRGEPARRAARPLLPGHRGAGPDGRSRRLHHLLGVARHQLRAAGARAAPGTHGRRGGARPGAHRDAVRGRGRDRRDHLLPRRAAAGLGALPAGAARR